LKKIKKIAKKESTTGFCRFDAKLTTDDLLKGTLDATKAEVKGDGHGGKD